MRTEIFESYSAFLDRSDESLNGVSQYFADANPNWAEERNNKGCWSCSGCSDCFGFKNNAPDKFPNIPKIESIHQKILEAVSGKDAFNMSDWHTCDTTRFCKII